MNNHPILCALALLAGASTSVSATDFPLSFTADGDSRWYEFETNSFIQLDRPASPTAHHLFSIAAEADPFDPTVYQVIGEVAVDPEDGIAAFPNGAAFAEIGVLKYNGSGDGTFAITEVLLDVYPHVARNVGQLGVDYRTTVLNPVGNVTVVGGAVTDIQLAADIRFEYNVFYIPSLGWTPFDGTLVIDGDDYQIFVDDTFVYSHGQLHYAWDLSGSIDGVGGSDVIFNSNFELN